MKSILLLGLLIFIIGCTQSNNFSQELEGAHQKIEQQQVEINTLKLEIESLKQKDKQVKESPLKIDLTQWKEDEIIKALSYKNKKFKDAYWFQYQYRDDGSYYDLVGKIFPVDPFYNLAYLRRSRELNVNGLRIFNLDPGNKEIGDEEFQKYENTVKKELIIDEELSCNFQKECRGTTLIVCIKESQQLYSWFSYPYLFIARNDGGETIHAFKEFYCDQ